MKKLRPILGISLLIQSVTFLILSLVNVEKNKNKSIAYGVFSALGGVAGAGLLAYEAKERKKNAFVEDDFDAEDYFDEILDGIDDVEIIDEDDIDCAFEAEQADAE